MRSRRRLVPPRGRATRWRPHPHGAAVGISSAGLLQIAGELRCAAALGKEAVGIDRKSTRLNSSHLVISYAVFCFKKRTQTRALGKPVIPVGPRAGNLHSRDVI